jgi:hypothetical protein
LEETRTLKRTGAEVKRKRFGRNENPEKNRDSVLAEAKPKAFQKK